MLRFVSLRTIPTRLRNANSIPSTCRYFASSAAGSKQDSSSSGSNAEDQSSLQQESQNKSSRSGDESRGSNIARRGDINSILGWNPFSDPFSFPSPFSRAFSDPFFNDTAFMQPFRSMFSEMARSDMKFPEVDIIRTDDGVKIEANIPGYSKENVSIDVDGRYLTISGEMNEESKRDEKSFHVRERKSGSFSRRFLLPEDAQLENIKAKMENGVLQLEIPVEKQNEEKKRIEIN